MYELNEIIHQPVRLRIMASLVTLDPCNQVTFNYLKKQLKLTDGNLGAHLKKLEESNYIEIVKTFVNQKPQTFIAPTPEGRKTFVEHVAALESLLKGEDLSNGNH